MNKQTIQQYVRIVLYWLFGALGTYGVSLGGSTKELIVSVVGTLATLAWTVWGSTLAARLEEIKATAGVEGVKIQVDPDKIDPASITAATPPGVTATPVL